MLSVETRVLVARHVKARGGDADEIREQIARMEAALAASVRDPDVRVFDAAVRLGAERGLKGRELERFVLRYVEARSMRLAPPGSPEHLEYLRGRRAANRSKVARRRATVEEAAASVTATVGVSEKPSADTDAPQTPMSPSSNGKAAATGNGSQAASEAHIRKRPARAKRTRPWRIGVLTKEGTIV